MPRILNSHIETTPGVCGGKPRIAGTRIRVQDVVVWTEQGMSPDEIVAGYPHLTLADVYAALAYYHDHQETIDRQMKQADEFVEMMKEKYGSTVRDPRESTDADGDPVSS